MSAVMLLWVIGVPVSLLALVLVLDHLEAFVLVPIDRAARVTRLVEESYPDVVERQVSVMLAPVTERLRSERREQAEARA